MWLTMTVVSTGSQTTPRLHGSSRFCTKKPRFISPLMEITYCTVLLFSIIPRINTSTDAYDSAVPLSSVSLFPLVSFVAAADS